MTDIPQYKIAQFNSQHNVTESQQFHALVEEVGELAECYNRDCSDERVAEELADVLFVTRSLAELREINISNELHSVITQNRNKDTNTEGQKVTKTTGETNSTKPQDALTVDIDTSRPLDGTEITHTQVNNSP